MTVVAVRLLRLMRTSTIEVDRENEFPGECGLKGENMCISKFLTASYPGLACLRP